MSWLPRGTLLPVHHLREFSVRLTYSLPPAHRCLESWVLVDLWLPVHPSAGVQRKEGGKRLKVIRLLERRKEQFLMK